MQRILYLVAYDISHPRRLARALKTMRAYATGGQKSVHECWLLSGRHSEATARLVGRPHDDAALRLLQYRRAIDAEACRMTAREIVAAKLAGEARLLGRALEVRPDRRKPLTDAIDTLARLQARLADRCEVLDRDTLTGLAGAGAAAYFRAYASLFAPSLEFSRRRRRPPPDPVNICLSLGYTLLHHEAVREVQVVGLDPLLGFLHVPERGRESLASDIIEPLRPHVDEWVWRRFAERQLRREHLCRCHVLLAEQAQSNLS